MVCCGLAFRLLKERFGRNVLPVAFAFFIFCPTIGFTQVTQPARFELTHENGDLPFTLISLKENGISMIREMQRPDGNKKKWEIILLDSMLQESWKTELPLDNHLAFVGYEYIPGELFYLFRKGEAVQSDFHMIRIFLFTHAVQQFDISPKLDFRLTHFTIVGNSALLGGYVTRQSSVLLYEMESRHLKVVPGFFVENTELLEVKANRNKTFNVLLVERGARERKLLLLKTFDESGTLLLEDDIETDPDKNILGGTTSTLENDELFLAGTWAPGSGKQAAGFFTSLVDPFNKQPVHYFDFGQLRHFFDFLPAKRATRIKDQLDKRRELQKPPLYRADIHLVRLEETDKGFLLLAELYVPSSSANYPPYNYNSPYNPNNAYYNPYGFNPMTMNRFYNSPYYGSPSSSYGSPYGPYYRNTDITVVESSLILFDQKGKLKEDFCLAVQDVKIPSLDQVSDFYMSDKFVQFYKKEKDIYIFKNWEDGSTAEQDTVKIKLKSAQDVVRNEWEEQSGIRYWFGPYAYAWGYESIRNRKEQAGDPVRYVYYVNKIKLE